MIATCEGVIELARTWRASGHRIASTNGCFDLLHIGHLATFAFAAQQADRLVVAVNDDASVRRLKGPGRPIVPAEQRALIVSVIRRVDAVVIFADDQLDALVEAIAPDVLIKGEQYRGKEIIGARHAKRVAYTPMVGGVSSTDLIRRLEGCTCEIRSHGGSRVYWK